MADVFFAVSKQVEVSPIYGYTIYIYIHSVYVYIYIHTCIHAWTSLPWSTYGLRSFIPYWESVAGSAGVKQLGSHPIHQPIFKQEAIDEGNDVGWMKAQSAQRAGIFPRPPRSKLQPAWHMWRLNKGPLSRHVAWCDEVTSWPDRWRWMDFQLQQNPYTGQLYKPLFNLLMTITQLGYIILSSNFWPWHILTNSGSRLR